MFSKKFLLDLLERSVWTFAQAAGASLLITGLDDWRTALGIAASAGALAVIKGVVASRVGDNSSAAAIPGG